MEKTQWVKNGIVFTGGEFKRAAIKVNGERITAVVINQTEKLYEDNADVIDAGGCLVVPGFIDAHVHFNDPGRTDWEGIETGSRAAAAGGTTTIFDMPLNSAPSVTSLSNLMNKKKHLTSLSHIDYALWGGLTGGNLSNETELEQMSKGIVAWKAFMCNSGIDDFPFLQKKDLKQAMIAAKNHGKLLALHAEDNEVINRLTSFYKNGKEKNERKAFLASRPVSAEQAAVSYTLDLAAKLGTAVHFVHISSAKTVGLIQQAKKSGVDVTVETCPHYLIFDEDDFLKTGAILKCAPPLRPRHEVEALWDCVENGWIDTIGSDHSPCLYSMKSTDSIWDAWGGIQGVQFTWLGLIDEALKRKISLQKILPLGTANPADRFGIGSRKGCIQAGLDADLVFISLDESTLANKESFLFRNPFSPYENRTFQLKIKKTMLRGKVIYEDRSGLSQEKSGVCI